MAEASTFSVSAKSAILMEASSGEVLLQYNADEKLFPASVTKIMTMLLIMEEINSGNLKFDDMVSVSENAMSYGGSTMFLEQGEMLSVNDMLKGIAVASANDGCVAMAEHISGSESAFVDKMNKRAKELGMENTNFMNTNGLDEENHYSSARDVAIMSRELMKYEKIFEALDKSYEEDSRENYVGKGCDSYLFSRVQTTAEHFAYLKIGEGCSNRCTYCAIPYIRGPFVSRKMEEIIEEAEEPEEVSEETKE